MRKRMWVALLAAAVLAGMWAVVPTSQAREATSCSWAIQQFSIANSNYQQCAAVYGPTPPNDSSHPCWFLFQTREHFRRLVDVSCQIKEQ